MWLSHLPSVIVGLIQKRHTLLIFEKLIFSVSFEIQLLYGGCLLVHELATAGDHDLFFWIFLVHHMILQASQGGDQWRGEVENAARNRRHIFNWFDACWKRYSRPLWLSTSLVCYMTYILLWILYALFFWLFLKKESMWARVL